MDPKQFVQKMREHPQLDLVHVEDDPDPSKMELFVRDSAYPHDLAVVTLEQVREYPWTDLEPVFLRDARIPFIRTLSRIVGYYSRVDNWNRSKVAELHDRHKGDYRLTGLQRLQREDLPQGVLDTVAQEGTQMACSPKSVEKPEG